MCDLPTVCAVFLHPSPMSSICMLAGSVKSGQQQQHGEGNAAAGMMIDMLECTLWQRQLGSLPEETVSALVAQVRS